MLSSRPTVGVHIQTAIEALPEKPLTSEFIVGSVSTNPVVIRRLLGPLREAGIVGQRMMTIQLRELEKFGIVRR